MRDIGRRKAVAAFLPAALVLCLAAPAAEAGAPTASAGTCDDCHGAKNLGGGEAPRLAGLPAGYFAAQLRAFADGRRTDAVMTPIAKTLDVAAMARLSVGYAAMAPTSAPPAPQAAPAVVARGERVASRGDWGRALPPCASCHGRHGLGVGEAFPPLVGQPAGYLAAQLRAWRAGTRHDDPQGLMHGVATRLDEDEIAAVAAYYASVTPGERR